MNWLLFFKIHHTEALVFIFIFGAIIGSFLNVVIYRYPIMLENEWNSDCLQQLKQPLPEKKETFNLCKPDSHCIQCKHKIPFWYNIPIISFLLLRGKCHFCHASISSQHLWVEILSAVLPLLIILHLGITIQSAALIIFTWGLITLCFIDLNHHFLPDPITYILLWFGLLLSIKSTFITPTDAILGALTGYLFLWIIAKVYILLRKKEGMGLGDCKMLAMIGAWVGSIALLNVLFFSSIIALITSFSLMLFKKLKFNNEIPFGPYLAIAGWCTAVYGSQIVNWVLRCL